MFARTARAGPSVQHNVIITSLKEASPVLQQRRHMALLKRARRQAKKESGHIQKNTQGQIVHEKKEKSLGAFRPLGVANLTNELFQSEKRNATLELPEFSTALSMLAKAAQFPIINNDPARIYGLPKKMLLEFRILSKPCSVVRKITIEVARHLDKVAQNPTPDTRVVIAGQAGCGKSFLLLQLVEHCIQKDWIVIYIPRAKKLVDSSTPHEYDLRTQTYLQPAFSLQTLQRIQATNQAKLATLTTRQKHIFEKREVPIGTNLNDFIAVAVKEPSLAPAILDVLISELSVQTKTPVLFAVDDFQALYCRTAYRDPHFVPIRPYHLSLPRMILEFASGKRSFAKGIFLGAITASDTIYKTPLELEETLELQPYHYRSPYDKRSRTLLGYMEGLKVIRVPQLSLAEAASLYEIWKEDRALVTSLHDETFLSKYTESSGNARDFVWKGMLATLES